MDQCAVSSGTEAGVLHFAYATPNARLAPDGNRLLRLDGLRVEDEIKTVEAAFAEAGASARVVLHGGMTPCGLAELLTLAERDLWLHISAHATDEGKHLLLENDIGVACPLAVSSFAAMLEVANRGSRIEFLCLSTCKSKHLGEAAREAGVNHVICTTDRVFDTSARCFSKTLYLSLARGRSVDKAFAEAKNTLQNHQDPRARGDASKFEHLCAEACKESRLRQGGAQTKAVPVPRPLPVPAECFVGREDVLRDILLYLRGTRRRILNIWGPRGIGKSSAAWEAVRFLGARGRDYWNRIACVQGPDGSEATAGGIRRELESVWAACWASAASRAKHQVPSTLLVVDDAEQAVRHGSATHALMLDLLRSYPPLKILLTTQVPHPDCFGGEYLSETIQMQPITSENATELFLNSLGPRCRGLTSAHLYPASAPERALPLDHGAVVRRLVELFDADPVLCPLKAEPGAIRRLGAQVQHGEPLELRVLQLRLSGRAETKREIPTFSIDARQKGEANSPESSALEVARDSVAEFWRECLARRNATIASQCTHELFDRLDREIPELFEEFCESKSGANRRFIIAQAHAVCFGIELVGLVDDTRVWREAYGKVKQKRQGWEGTSTLDEEVADDLPADDQQQLHHQGLQKQPLPLVLGQQAELPAPLQVHPHMQAEARCVRKGGPDQGCRHDVHREQQQQQQQPLRPHSHRQVEAQHQLLREMPVPHAQPLQVRERQSQHREQALQLQQLSLQQQQLQVHCGPREIAAGGLHQQANEEVGYEAQEASESGVCRFQGWSAMHDQPQGSGSCGKGRGTSLPPPTPSTEVPSSSGCATPVSVVDLGPALERAHACEENEIGGDVPYTGSTDAEALSAWYPALTWNPHFHGSMECRRQPEQIPTPISAPRTPPDLGKLGRMGGLKPTGVAWPPQGCGAAGTAPLVPTAAAGPEGPVCAEPKGFPRLEASPLPGTCALLPDPHEFKEIF